MGNYIDSNLAEGEHVVYETRIHWLVFLRPTAILTLWIAPLIEYFTNEFAITNTRVIIKRIILV